MTTQTQRSQSLTNLIVRLFIIGYSLLTITIIAQSYHFSINSINNERERSLVQTNALLKNVLQYKLAALRTNQSTHAASSEVFYSLSALDASALDSFFFNAEQKDPSTAPDFRFITNGNQLLWDDGSSYFHGIDHKVLQQLIDRRLPVNRWNFTHLPASIGDVDLLVRSTPIIDNLTGKVAGELNVVVVLNNNLSLIDSMREASNVDALFLAYKNDIIATNLSVDSPTYTLIQEQLHSNSGVKSNEQHLIHASDFEIAHSASLTFITVQSNASIILLRNKFLAGVMLSLVVIGILAMITRGIIKNRIIDSLNRLMNYTRSATDISQFRTFSGTPIREFNQIGSTLQHTLSTLIEKEQSLDDLFKISLSPTIVWGVDAKIQRINPAAIEQFEYDLHSRFQGNCYFDFERQIMPSLKLALNGELQLGIHTTVNDKVHHWNLAPLIIDGDVIAVIAQAQDITSLIEAERQSRRAQIAAEASARAKSDFLAKMSHEIRTPLNGILGIAQILKGSLTDPQQVEKVDVLYQSGEHLLTVLNDILDFSRIEEGKFQLEFNQFKLGEMLKPINDVYAPLCDKKNITFDINCDVEPDRILYSDRSRVLQVLFNLMSNAVKFTHAGRISLSVSEPTPNLLKFEVRDSGIGIDQKRIPDLFQPFIQAEASTTREYGGSGLGLSIVKSLVELLGGTVSAASEMGEGSTFAFTLPSKDIDTSDTIAQSTATVIASPVTENEESPIEELDITSATQGIRLLLVEDNKTNAFVAKVFCKKYGIEVTWVENGHLAIDALQNEEFDLIFMDNHMPKMGGIETTAKARQLLNCTTPIFACTADAFPEAHDAFMQAGANYVLVKPIKDETFSKALRYYVSHCAPQRLKEIEK
uniref:LuxQ periplasmic sensor domain-containing protein n=1 Tax=Thaumasiovibrio occultus TaxID=1891184 RepID=UPI000B35BA56|nr:LuxQ periplasmic sensor domain-containing protein [Thaumasiovibrio occultus]